MSFENILDLLYDMCRLCLERIGKHNLFVPNSSYIDEIAECAGIQIFEDASLPQTICEVCVDRLRVCKSFRELAARTDQRLRALRTGRNDDEDDYEMFTPKIVMAPPKDDRTQDCCNEKEDDDSSQRPSIRVRVDIFDGSEHKASTSTAEKAKQVDIEGRSIENADPVPVTSQFFNKEKDSNTDEPVVKRKRRKRVTQEPQTDDECFTKEKDSNTDEPVVKRNRKKRVTQEPQTDDEVESKSCSSINESKVEMKAKLENDLVCEICNKVCSSTKALYHHRRGHTKNHVCPMCVKAFSSKNDLTKHIRTHTGEKPFQCTMCEKGFTQAGTLKAHMETHSKRFQIAQKQEMDDHGLWGYQQCKCICKNGEDIESKTYKYMEYGSNYDVGSVNTSNLVMKTNFVTSKENSLEAGNNADESIATDDVKNISIDIEEMDIDEALLQMKNQVVSMNKDADDNLNSTNCSEHEIDENSSRGSRTFLNEPFKVKIGISPRLQAAQLKKQVDINTGITRSEINKCDTTIDLNAEEDCVSEIKEQQNKNVNDIIYNQAIDSFDEIIKNKHTLATNVIEINGIEEKPERKKCNSKRDFSDASSDSNGFSKGYSEELKEREHSSQTSKKVKLKLKKKYDHVKELNECANDSSANNSVTSCENIIHEISTINDTDKVNRLNDFCNNTHLKDMLMTKNNNVLVPTEYENKSGNESDINYEKNNISNTQNDIYDTNPDDLRLDELGEDISDAAVDISFNKILTTMDNTADAAITIGGSSAKKVKKLKKTYECKTCLQTFTTQKIFFQHKREHRQILRFC